MERTATSRSVVRACSTSRPISVDFPTPGGPVKPTMAACPVFGYTSRTSAHPSGSSSSTREIARASARLSPASRRSARSAAVRPEGAIATGILWSASKYDRAHMTTGSPTETEALAGPPPSGAPDAVRRAPAPLHGGLLTLLRFSRRHDMLNLKYARLLVRLLRRRFLTPTGRRLRLGGIAFIGPKVVLQIGKNAEIKL